MFLFNFIFKADRTICEICRAGVICLPLASDDNPLPRNASLETMNSFLCPPGYFCPTGSLKPTGCPAGFFGSANSEGFESELSCQPCSPNYFTFETGQTACLSCGGQARQPSEGSATCLCTGSGREFQPSDRQCVCKIGYEEKVINQRKECIKKIYEICRPGTYRDLHGNCMSPEEFETYCIDICGSNSVVGFDKETGMCNCAQPDLETICNFECRTSRKTNSARVSADEQ